MILQASSARADADVARVGFDSPHTAVYDVYSPDGRAAMMAPVLRTYVERYNITNYWLDCDEPCGEYLHEEDIWYGEWPAAAVGAAYSAQLDAAVRSALGPYNGNAAGRADVNRRGT